MKPHPQHPDIYQLRIVLRDISPLIWRRLLVRSDTTLAQLHLMIQILFAWGNEHLHHFHVFGKDYGSDGADTRIVGLHRFGLRHGERFRYVYNYYAQWQCDIRLEATLPFDPKRFYPACTGGKRPAPPEHVQDAWTYLALLDEHRYPSWEALRVLADAAQVVLVRLSMSQSETLLAILTRFVRRWIVSSSINSFNPTRLSGARSIRSCAPGHGQEQMSHEIQGASCHPSG